VLLDLTIKGKVTLSANCLLTASSDAWVPLAISTSTLNLGGIDLRKRFWTNVVLKPWVWLKVLLAFKID
jgi:hypothetical protein